MSIQIRNYVPQDDESILELWNTAGVRAGYAPLNLERLRLLMLRHPDFKADHSFVLTEDGRVEGFANGCTGNHLARGAERGYLSLLLLSEEADSAENTRMLLDAVEAVFRREGKKYAAVTFFCPIRLPWVIPDTPGHEHNNMPGIATDLPLCERMIAYGYRQGATEMAMYLNLKQFAMPESILQKEKQMAAEGYTVARYQEGVHQGVDEMVASLQNSMWSAEVPAAAHEGMNLLVGLKGNTVAGFTGPVYPEETGRGYFAGLAVQKEYERHGLGTLLFYRLLQEEKKCGSAYMSLFTGTDNPAQRIYLGAGFMPRRYFAVMLKEL